MGIPLNMKKRLKEQLEQTVVPSMLIGYHGLETSMLMTELEHTKLFERLTSARKVDEMKAAIDTGYPYLIIAMDLNLGMPASPDISPAIEVYGAFKKSGFKSYFIGFSSTYKAVDAARESGIPAMDKFQFATMMGQAKKEDLERFGEYSLSYLT